MDHFQQTCGDVRLALFLDRLHCHLCRQPLVEAAMRPTKPPGELEAVRQFQVMPFHAGNVSGTR
jgi:hypothetical protein